MARSAAIFCKETAATERDVATSIRNEDAPTAGATVDNRTVNNTVKHFYCDLNQFPLAPALSLDSSYDRRSGGHDNREVRKLSNNSK